jgi:glycosyltransferase involved in cell wall biosynthesis
MKVSVNIITYNQENYIAEALDSVLIQKVDFDYEIVIGEDCSTDKTRSILIDYKRRYPNKVKLLLHDWNVGAVANFDSTLKTSTGEYIACLEGDDYWLDPDKLQKQVDFMDNHNECSMCFHRAKMFHEDGSQKSIIWGPPVSKEFFQLDEVIRHSFIPGASILFRRKLFSHAPKELYANQAGDKVLYCLLAAQGKIGFIDEVMSAYRIHPAGVWSSMSMVERFQTVIGSNRNLKGKIPREHNKTLNKNIAHGYRQLADFYRKKGITSQSIWNLLNAWWTAPDRMPLGELTRSLYKIISTNPTILKILKKEIESRKVDPEDEVVSYYPKYDWKK